MSAPVGRLLCPHLGLRADPATRFLYPSTAQGCHSAVHYARVDTASQAATCLTMAHLQCPRYLEAAATSRSAPAAPPGPTRVIGPIRPLGARDSARGCGVGLVRFALGLLLVWAIGFGVGVALGGLGSSATAPGGVLPGLSPAAAPSAGLTAAPTPAPTPSAPTPATSPSASQVVARSQAPESAAPRASLRTHTVLRGETLTSIAARYGVTPQAIAKANGIKDPNQIVTGSVLVIP